MAQNRLFDENELKEMGRRTVDLVQEAIDAGDHERAKKLTRRMYREFLAMHDLYIDWVTSLLSFIGTRYGDDAIHDALIANFEAWFKPPFENLYANADARRKAQLFIGALKGHLQPIRIEEDDEKVVMMMEPCGSGGRSVLDGKYEPPNGFLRIKKPQPMTFERADFPVYCTHCAIQEMLPIEWEGVALTVIEPAENIGEEPCKFILYKDPAAIPDKYYKRFGKEKS
ncbi:hypothetical protein ACFLV3_05120 [Chloroflexota bacterium]